MEKDNKVESSVTFENCTIDEMCKEMMNSVNRLQYLISVLCSNKAKYTMRLGPAKAVLKVALAAVKAANDALYELNPSIK